VTRTHRGTRRSMGLARCCCLCPACCWAPHVRSTSRFTCLAMLDPYVCVWGWDVQCPPTLRHHDTPRRHALAPLFPFACAPVALF
jgi:hypothetical protein